MGGFASSRILEVHGERMVKRTFDTGLSHRAASEGPEPRAVDRARSSASRCRTPRPRRSSSMPARRNGFAALDHSALVRALEKLANFEIGQSRARRRDAAKPRYPAMTRMPRDLLRAMFDAAILAAQPARCLPPHLPHAAERPHARRSAPAKRRPRWQARWRTTGPGALSGLVVTRYGYAVPCRAHRDRRGRASCPGRGRARPRHSGLSNACRGLTADDLVIVLISGGGSSLLALPAPTSRSTTSRTSIARCSNPGATISEMNCVRRHLSAIKGGRLAAACHPARVVTLLMSDVPGDDPMDIASGPTVADPTTCADALDVLAPLRHRAAADGTPCARVGRRRDGEAGRSAACAYGSSDDRDAAAVARGGG